MSYFLIVCLILIGFVLVTLEMIVVPGIGLAGVAGIGSLGYALYGTFTYHGEKAGYITLAIVLVLSVVLLIFIMRSRTWRKLALNTSVDARVNEESSRLQAGMKGIASSRLAPMGTIEVNGEFFEASSVSAFIDQHTPVEIIKVEGGKVWVKADPQEQGIR